MPQCRLQLIKRRFRRSWVSSRPLASRALAFPAALALRSGDLGFGVAVAAAEIWELEQALNETHVVGLGFPSGVFHGVSLSRSLLPSSFMIANQASGAAVQVFPDSAHRHRRS